jgi:hypothetical protein
MVGVYSKIKNGLNWLKGKAAKYVAPVVGTLGDIANSDFVQGAAGFLNPFLNSVAPGLGTGISTGLSYLGKAGDIANGLAEDYKEKGDDFGFSDMYDNIRSGKYTNRKSKVPKGIGLSKRPDELHPPIELKSLPGREDEDVVGPNIEEVD